MGLQPPQEIERWRWINGPASAVAFAREGGIFAVAGNNTVQVRQVDDEPNVGVREIVRLPIDGAELSSLSFGPSGNWILTAAETLTQWPLVSGSEHVRLHFDTTVEALAVSPDPAARRLAMTLGDGTLRIWDTSTWRELPKREIQKVDGRETRSSVASVMAFSANASWLAATIDKTLTVFSTADWRELTHSEHADAVGKVGFTSDNRLLIAVSDTHVSVTSTASWKSVLVAHETRNGTISINPDGTMMAIRHAPSCQRAEVVKGSTLVWQTADGKPVATLPLGAELIPAGSTCSEKTTIRRW